VARAAVARDTLAALVQAARARLQGPDAGSAPLALVRARAAFAGGDDASPPPPAARGAVGGAPADGALGRLAALLLPRELRAALPGGGALVVVPHGVLALVPFAALPLGTGAVGGQYAVRYVPSLSALGAERRPAPGAEAATALVVGDPAMPALPGAGGRAAPLPALPGAAREARWVAARLGVLPLTGRAATESAVRARLPRARLVHLATHGYAFASDARARDSFVALAADPASDGLLTAGELLDAAALALAADLVVLSACQTGLGRATDAEGPVGLARAFLARGARSVLVSLWSVSDAATALLMRRFYAHWLGDRDRPGKAEALRRAQADVRRTPGFAPPRFWAAFQLVGAA
jgi:CHAT domain-containing protein